MKGLSPYQIIPARRLDGSEHCHTLLLPHEIAYAFVGSSLFCELIKDQTTRSHLFRPHRLYLQTNKGVYFSSSHRSLKELCDRIPSDLFLYIRKSLVINIQKAREIDLREKQIGIAVADGSMVWLTISRRYIKDLRRRLFFSGD